MVDVYGMHSSNSKNRHSLFVEVSFSNGTLKASLVGPRIGDREATLVANIVNAKLKAYGERVNALILDVSKVEFMSSLGLGMCIDVRNNAEDIHAETAIIGLSIHLQELFHMMKLEKLFQIEPRQVDINKAA